MELSFQQLQMIANRQSFILANGEKTARNIHSTIAGALMNK